VKRGVTLLLIALGALVGAFLWGRASKPVEVRQIVKVETRTEYVDRWQEKIVYRDRVKVQTKIRTVTVVEPSGATTTTTTDDSTSESVTDAGATASGQSTGTTDTKSETVTVTRTARAGWRLEVGARWDIRDITGPRPDAYGFTFSRRLVGPFWLGAHYSTDRVAGLTAGVEW
jgi:hypothetical protein